MGSQRCQNVSMELLVERQEASESGLWEVHRFLLSFTLSVFGIVAVAQESVLKWQIISEKVSKGRKMLFESQGRQKSPEERTLSLGHFLPLAHEHLLSFYYVPGTMLIFLDQCVCDLSPNSTLDGWWTAVQWLWHSLTWYRPGPQGLQKSVMDLPNSRISRLPAKVPLIRSKIPSLNECWVSAHRFVHIILLILLNNSLG